MVISINWFCVSQRKGDLKLIFIIWLIANGVLKHVFTVLGHISITISYDTGLKSMEAIEKAQIVQLKEFVRSMSQAGTTWRELT